MFCEVLAVWFCLEKLAKQLIYNILMKFLFGLFDVFPNKQTDAYLTVSTI
jgi:hypothetical protein